MTDKYGDYDEYHDSESQAALGLAAWEHARQESYLRRRFPNGPSKWRVDDLGGPTQKTSAEHPLTLRDAIFGVLFCAAVLGVGLYCGYWWALAAAVLGILGAPLFFPYDETQKAGPLDRPLRSFFLGAVLRTVVLLLLWQVGVGVTSFVITGAVLLVFVEPIAIVNPPLAGEIGGVVSSTAIFISWVVLTIATMTNMLEHLQK